MHIKKLSYKKIQVDYYIPIIVNNIIIDNIQYSQKYLIKDNDIQELHNYKIHRKISGIYKIKMKHILIKKIISSIQYNEFNYITYIPQYMQFNDLKWFMIYNRNSKIEEILK